jgi:hypothetical protein
VAICRWSDASAQALTFPFRRACYDEGQRVDRDRGSARGPELKSVNIASPKMPPVTDDALRVRHQEQVIEAQTPLCQLSRWNSSRS